MVDHSAKITHVRIHRNHNRSELSDMQAQKLESIMARSYTDDVDLRRGLATPPRNHFRPGQRDDEVHYGFARVIPCI